VLPLQENAKTSSPITGTLGKNPRVIVSSISLTWQPALRLLPLLCASVLAGFKSHAAEVTWKQCLSQEPAWYATPEAVRIADNVLLYQRASGGWPKNLDMAKPLDATDQAQLENERWRTDSTIDNGATTTQLRFLARLASGIHEPRFQDAFLRGLDYLFAAQYPNGGWPQSFPRPKGYSAHVTFNDDAMVNVLKLLRDIARRDPEYAFVEDSARQRAEQAVAKGVDCILSCQVIVSNRRTAWCAQHDAQTLAPAPARSYEKVSLSGSESVGIVRFLMGIEQPGPQVRQAIEAAVAWFRETKLTGIRQVDKPDPALPGNRDRVIVLDPNAPPLWARFYEIGTNRPMFCGRDGIIRFSPTFGCAKNKWGWVPAKRFSEKRIPSGAAPPIGMGCPPSRPGPASNRCHANVGGCDETVTKRPTHGARSPEVLERKELSMAGVTRLELATSAVTGQRSNQLSYTPASWGSANLKEPIPKVNGDFVPLFLSTLHDPVRTVQDHRIRATDAKEVGVRIPAEENVLSPESRPEKG
jgi:PelA/Pel-15E family pectate lyase